MADSILQKSKYCYITGYCADGLHKHHIYFGTGRRRISEMFGFWVWLKPEYHNASRFGVHGMDGHELDMKLKRECQAEFEKTHTREEFRALIGKSYL